MDMTTLITIITSAAVGALASSILSLIGQHLERKSRREELLMVKAIDLAMHKTDLVKELTIKLDKSATIHDTVFLAAEYYKDLRHLIKRGGLRPETISKGLKSSQAGVG